MRLKAHLPAAAAAVVLALTPSAASAATSQAISTAAGAGADWIEDQQNTDGTFPPGFSSFDPTAVPLASAGRHAADLTNTGPSHQDALFGQLNGLAAPTTATSIGAHQLALLSATAAGIDPARVSASKNVVANLAGVYADGYFGDSSGFSGFNFVAYGTLALNETRAPRFLVDRQVAVIRANQHDDGGWDYPRSDTAEGRQGLGSVDMTGAALSALCGAGVPSSDNAVKRGVAFLRSYYVPSSGAIVGPPETFGSANSSSTSLAVSGLKACGVDPQGDGFDTGATPVDYVLSLQASGGANAGGFRYDASTATPDIGSTRDATQALAGSSLSADPPPRATGLPRRRPVTPPAGGTSVPVTLAVDDGAGRVTLCRVTVPTGSSLATLLSTAGSSSTPAGCATGAEFSGGLLSKLNGQSGTWAFSVDDGGETAAGSQSIGFGDFVGLRRTSAPAGGGSGGTGGDMSAPIPAAQKAKTTPTGVSSRALKVSARKRVVTLSLTCAKDNRLCQGVAYVIHGKRTLGRRPFLIGGGKTTKVNVKLYKSAMKRLGKRKRRVKVNVFSRDGAGIASTSSRTLTLTPTK